MLTRKFRNALLIWTSAFSVTASGGAGQGLPKIRELGPVITRSTMHLQSVSSVRQLPHGRILVNDIVGRRVVLFDSALTAFKVVADSTGQTGNAYGLRPGGLIAYRGDSTLFVDPESLSMLVIDTAGRLARVIAAPRAADASFLVGGPFGTPGFDGRGRIVYRGGTGPFRPAQPADSAPIVRVDLATRKVDTVASFRIPKAPFKARRNSDGSVSVTFTFNPLQVIDNWALVPDGAIAVVRGTDFHIDWFDPDGTRTSTDKIPFDWERLTDERKLALVDSVRSDIEGQRAAARGRGEGGTTTMSSGGASGATTTLGLPQYVLVEPADLPDYRPAFTQGATRADPEGNLWIRTTHSVAGRPVYDVVNRRGRLVDRVQIPSGRVIAGFAPNGFVYLAVIEAGGVTVERARVR